MYSHSASMVLYVRSKEHPSVLLHITKFIPHFGFNFCKLCSSDHDICKDQMIITLMENSRRMYKGGERIDTDNFMTICYI